MSQETRVRFAPSPTGSLHIGNARTAILNWLFARHTGGSFILRIEDTDLERSSKESEESIYNDLHWLGINWDEGPDVGGKVGPYRQMERTHLYEEYTNKLLANGHAYHCFCTQDELEEMRQKALAEGKTDAWYDGRHRNLTTAQKQAFREEGRQPVVRLKYPDQDITFIDIVKGETTFPAGSTGDFVIVRSDGTPTYNFAAVIDDGLMKISHVIRGDDHLSNTPKQIAVYNALGWKVPIFAHIPMILGPDKSRLSKRHGATSVRGYADAGFLPDALINFMSLLSWSSPSGDEILSIQRLIDEFDFSRVSKSPAVFNVEKLEWMNGMYIRSLAIEKLTDLCLPYLQNAGYHLPERSVLEQIVAMVQENLERLKEIVEKLEFVFADKVIPATAEAVRMIEKESTSKVFWSFLRQLDKVEQLDFARFRQIMKTVSEETGVMGKDLWMPLRVALTGQIHGPDLPKVVDIFGKERCKKLVESALNI
ncbi:MAG: glutamate--tRNA ligase [Deferribacteres bacterium]|nr:glutamate--tRNA ligase [candidate division KSB1 bacterium]MCB9502620.1 glutamate--tRNA ligase [Deferribacteres bacterium]